MERDASGADPCRQRSGFVGLLYGEFTDTLDDRLRYSMSLTESALTIQKISSSPGRTKVVFDLSDCVGCRAYRGSDSADVGAYFTAYFYPFKGRWMSAGVARQRVEQCFRVALVQDPVVNLQEAERWASAIRDASERQAPRREGEHFTEMITSGLKSPNVTETLQACVLTGEGYQGNINGICQGGKTSQQQQEPTDHTLVLYLV